MVVWVLSSVRGCSSALLVVSCFSSCPVLQCLAALTKGFPLLSLRKGVPCGVVHAWGISLSETCKGGIKSFLMKDGYYTSSLEELHVVSSVSFAFLTPRETGRSLRNALSRTHWVTGRWAGPLSPVTITVWAGLILDIGKAWQACPSQVITCLRLLLVRYGDEWF